MYTCTFYILCVVCIISVFDRYDVSHIDFMHLKELVKRRKSSVVLIIYVACLIVHLVTARVDDKLGLMAYNISNLTMTQSELQYWTNLSYWRAILATFGWVIVGSTPSEDLYYIHLKNMEKYFVPDN